MPGGWTEPSSIDLEALLAPLYGQPQYGEATYGGVFEALTADVRTTDEVQVSYGIAGIGPTDRLAGGGSMAFVLDNSASNSGGVIGYYTPGHASARIGWALSTKVRLSVAYGELYGVPKYGAEIYGERWYEFVGWVNTIAPALDVFGDRVVRVQAGDWLDRASTIKTKRIRAETNIRSDTVVERVLASATIQPESVDLGAGTETFTYALDDLRDERSALTEALYRTVLSEFGYAYVRNAVYPGGLFMFEGRSARFKSISSSWSPAEGTFHDGGAEQSLNEVLNLIKTTSFPRAVSTSNEVLATLRSPVQIRGHESILIILRYNDPSAQSTRISGTSMVTPVSGTDYNFSSASEVDDGDMNSSVTVAVAFGANEVAYLVTNNVAATGYVTTLQARGLAIRLYDPVVQVAEDVSSQDRHDIRTVDLNLPYQDQAIRAEVYGDLVLKNYKSPIYSRRLTFKLNGDNTKLTKGLQLGPGDRVTLAEQASALSGDWIISAATVVVSDNNQIEKTWAVVPANSTDYWQLGTATLSELGSTTVLGP